MPNTPENLKYSREDEWVMVEGAIAIIGISDYAQDALSDIVYLELPSVGDTFNAGDIFGVVESVKAASDLYTPLTIEVVEVNDALIDTPEIINEDPYERGWMIKTTMQDESELNAMMSAAAYDQYCAER
ncbi:glycine cleavage system protein GcvH [Chloroflexi bacterium TSY]|nr:glycine cleavage system protein GcvH [Chloroflexi bacterium TSY]